MTIPLSTSRLEALLESAELLHSSLDLDALVRHLLRTAMGRTVATRGVVTQRVDGTEYVVVARGVKGLASGAPFDAVTAHAAGLRIFVPIGQPPDVLGTLALSLPTAGRIDPEEETFLSALAGIAASGISNARAHSQVRQLNVHLDSKVQQLQTLLELARALTEASEPDEIAQLLGLTLSGQWAASRYSVLAVRDGHPPVSLQKNVALTWPAPWISELLWTPGAVRVESMPPGPLHHALADQRLAVAFPLRTAAGTFGLAAVGPRPGGTPYSESDLEFGAGLVAQAVVAFENVWQLRELLEKKQIERELALAASIQQNLFPAELPVVRGCDVAAINRPARLVGGDYYDALALDPVRDQREYLFCVADVSGKGIAASLLMSNMQATLRALLGREASLAELARCTNELLFVSTPGNKYVTAVLLSLDPGTGTCTYVNCGHTEGLVLRCHGGIEWLPTTGIALGMFPGQRYDELRLRLAPGDTVALYSDGVTEALNPNDEEFGSQRLIQALRRRAGQPASAIVSAVLAEIEAFCESTPQYDDITLLVLKREPMAS